MHALVGVRVPASLVALPLVIGSVAGLLLADGAESFLPLCAASGAVLALLAGFASINERPSPDVALAVAIGSLLAGLSLGVSEARAAAGPPLVAWFDAHEAELRDEPAWLEGVLREDAVITPFGASLTLDARTPCPGGVRIAVGGSAVGDHISGWRAGRTIRAPVLLRRPTSFRDPGLPDERRTLARRGIALLGSIKSAGLVEVRARGSVAAEAVAAARVWARAQLARDVGRWSPQSAALASAILIGDRSGLSNEDERRLQRAGTYHVIAISGGNIAILTAVLLWALRIARVPSRAAASITIVALAFYGQIAGSLASVARAVIAAGIYLSGRVLDHRGPPLNALAIAAVCALGASALGATDAGFILSFGATLGILLGVSHVSPAIPRGPAGLLRRMARVAVASAAALLAATVCAEVALVPASAAIFSRVTFAGLILNFAAIPLMTIAQVAAMGTLVAAAVAAPVASSLGYVTHLAATGLVGSAHLVDMAPWLSRDVSPPAWWVCAAYYASCLVMLGWRRYRWTGLAGVSVSGVVILMSPGAASRDAVSRPPPGTLRVVFLDVGQGDATLIELPDGHSLLVDAGGVPGSTFDIGERVVRPALRAFGVRRLDTLVLTHGDPDHIGGAPAVVRSFTPHTIWEGIPVPPHEGLRTIMARAASAGASWRTVQAGDVDRAGGIEIHVLHPPPPDWERQRVRNDDSIVLALRLGAVSILLPGDIGQEPERAIVPRLALAPTVIVKAPHHGSATSSTPEFIAATRPAAVIFSAGPGNRFGHPAPVVVGRYRAAGAAIFRTDEDGAVILETDGKSVEIRTWTGRGVILRP